MTGAAKHTIARTVLTLCATCAWNLPGAAEPPGGVNAVRYLKPDEYPVVDGSTATVPLALKLARV